VTILGVSPTSLSLADFVGFLLPISGDGDLRWPLGWLAFLQTSTKAPKDGTPVCDLQASPTLGHGQSITTADEMEDGSRAFVVQHFAHPEKHGLEMNLRIVCFGGGNIHRTVYNRAGALLFLELCKKLSTAVPLLLAEQRSRPAGEQEHKTLVQRSFDRV
jgi:hypothetical protein